jgi:hypothetical protein
VDRRYPRRGFCRARPGRVGRAVRTELDPPDETGEVIAQPLDCCAVRPVNRKASYQWRLREIYRRRRPVQRRRPEAPARRAGIALVSHVDRLAAAAARHGNEIIGPALGPPGGPGPSLGGFGAAGPEQRCSARRRLRSARPGCGGPQQANRDHGQEDCRCNPTATPVPAPFAAPIARHQRPPCGARKHDSGCAVAVRRRCNTRG